MQFQGQIESHWVGTLLSWVVPTLVFLAIWGFLMRRMGPASGLMTIGKSKAKVYMEKSTGVTFDDAAGIDEARAELMEIVDFLKQPERYRRPGADSQGRVARRAPGLVRLSWPKRWRGKPACLIAYEESRARFREYLDVMRLAWTQERFSYAGTFYTFRDVELIPKPYQHPHPPLHHAATTRETFAAIGTLGFPLLVGLASAAMSELAEGIAEYQAAWHEAGHLGQGEVRLRLPIYVAQDMDRARSEPQASAMPYYERVRQAYLRSANTFENPARAARAARLATLTYEDVVQTRVVFGTPTFVTERLSTLRHEVGLSGIIMEPNIGGRIPYELLLHSMRLFTQEVAPSLR